MDPRDLTAAEIAAALARMRPVPAAVLRVMGRDPRACVRRLAARCRAAAVREQREAVRLRTLYREQRRRAGRAGVVAGVDEAGRGPLAGPVVAAAVILRGAALPGLDDSKRLRPDERERLDREIRARAQGVGVGEASVEEIDALNIVGATRLAMRRAVVGLAAAPDLLLIDGRERLPGLCAQVAVIDGDATCACIAAASVVAKVARDRIMRRLDGEFPGYGFARHKGYGTSEHLAALARHGPSPVHRRAFLSGAQIVLFEFGR